MTVFCDLMSLLYVAEVARDLAMKPGCVAPGFTMDATVADAFPYPPNVTGWLSAIRWPYRRRARVLLPAPPRFKGGGNALISAVCP